MPIGYHWLFFGAVLTCQLALSAHVLLTKTDDSGESAFWLLAIWLVPLAGMICYLFFGITRLRHVSKLVNAAERRFKERLPRPIAEVVGAFRRPDETPLARTLARALPRSCFLDGNHLELLHDGVAAYPRMLEDIQHAKHCVRMQSYILMNDASGGKILAALRRKAAEGVEVRILFDNLGSLKALWSYQFRKLMKRETKHFMMKSFSPLNIFAPWKFQMRNHRKLLIIDGCIAYSGGINISDGNERLQSVPKEKYIHDLHCRITGPAVAAFTMAFFHNWAYATRRKFRADIIREDFPQLASAGNDTVRVVASGPGDDADGSRKLFFTAASLAQKSLYIATPYFVPGPEYLAMLASAARRGVDVRVIVPEASDHKFVSLASEANYRRLLTAGVRIYRKQGYFSHIKLLQADGEWGFMGSSNCDSRSFHLNFELDFCFTGGDFVAEVVHTFQSELKGSVEVKLRDFERRTVARRLAEGVCALLSPIL